MIDGVTEKWIPIPGCEGRYSACIDGRIFSYVKYPDGQEIGYINISEYTSRRYVHFAFSKKWNYRISRLIMLTFEGPCPEGMEVCHNNGNSLDDRLINLRYDTHKNNTLDSIKHGTFHLEKGEAHRRAILNKHQVYLIRLLYDIEYKTCIELAKFFNINTSHISKIGLRQQWKHLPELPEEEKNVLYQEFLKWEANKEKQSA